MISNTLELENNDLYKDTSARARFCLLHAKKRIENFSVRGIYEDQGGEPDDFFLKIGRLMAF